MTAEGGPSVAIAGGGIIGLAIAWRLAQERFRVTIYDKGPLGNEASWAGAGMLSPGGEIAGRSALASLAIQSREMYPQFVRQLAAATGLAIDYQECGALELAYSPGEMESLEARAAAQAGLGIFSKPLTAEMASVFCPRVRTGGLAGARLYPSDALVDPREVMAALNAVCSSSGATLKTECAVEAIAVGPDEAAVHSGREMLSYDCAVVAAGAWSGSIRVSGVPPLPPAEPIKGQLIGYRQPVRTCPIMLRHGRNYVLQRANGSLIVGTSEERVGFDRAVTPAITQALARAGGFLLPHLAETKPSEAWVGFRPGSDELHIGPWHSNRLYLAYGHYRNGILLAPVTAERIRAGIMSNLGKC